MTSPSTILHEQPDLDTLGGRIGRAREATGRTAEEAAVQLGVTRETYENWEADREEPRANRLAMLAGFLNVSPSWLLHGVGESPSHNSDFEMVSELEEKLARIEDLHNQTSEAIENLRNAIQRLSNNQGA
ncbi:MAG: helix-turn-helix transcriptional regulator [Pseudomonadota bacterium]